MLSRILLATRDTAIRRRLQKSLTQPDIVIDVLSPTRDVWERLANADTDCMIIDRALIPRPATHSIASTTATTALAASPASARTATTTARSTAIVRLTSPTPLLFLWCVVRLRFFIFVHQPQRPRDEPLARNQAQFL